MVREYLSETATPKNAGFAPTTGRINSPDNLAQDALGNIYVIEDAPNGSSTGGDIWFARDEDNDGVAESVDHFLSVRVAGSEATGMIFNPANPLEFAVNVQHPESADLDAVPNGFGDALWLFNVAKTAAPCAEGERCSRVNRTVTQLAVAGIKQRIKNIAQTLKCRLSIWQQMHDWSASDYQD
jgi:secreted PhoX family phosphatase